MSNTSYTQIRDTEVDATNIMSSLSDRQKTDLVSQSCRLNTTISPTTANIALTNTMLLAALSPYSQFIDGSGLTAARNLTVGADTAANAKAIQDLFGMTTAADAVMLRFPLAATSAGFAINLANTSGTHTFVNINLLGGADASSRALAVASSTAQNSSDIRVVVTADTVTAGSEVVTFSILKQGAV